MSLPILEIWSAFFVHMYSSREVGGTHLEAKKPYHVSSKNTWVSILGFLHTLFLSTHKWLHWTPDMGKTCQVLWRTQSCPIWSPPSISLKSFGDRQICKMHGRIYIHIRGENKAVKIQRKGRFISSKSIGENLIGRRLLSCKGFLTGIKELMDNLGQQKKKVSPQLCDLYAEFRLLQLTFTKSQLTLSLSYSPVSKPKETLWHPAFLIVWLTFQPAKLIHRESLLPSYGSRNSLAVNEHHCLVLT